MSHTNLRPAFFCSAPGSRPGLGEHLEAVADPDDGAAGGRVLGDRVHHRREPGDRAGAQVVAVREPAGHDDRVDAARRVRSPCQSSSASPPSCSTARTTSSSQFVPGNTTTPTRALTRRVTDLGDLDGVALDHRVGEEALAHLVDLGAGGVGDVGVEHEPDGLARSTPRSRSSYPSAGSARSTVAPCGSRTPGRCVTSIRAAYLTRSASSVPARRSSRPLSCSYAST